MRKTNPQLYTATAHLLDYPSYWVSRNEGVAFGPVKLAVFIAPFTHPEKIVLLGTGGLGMQNQLILERIDINHVRLQLIENSILALTTAPISATHGILYVGIEAPWLYPPAASPYWDGFASNTERYALQHRFVIAAGGQVVSVYFTYFFDSTGFYPFIRGRGEVDASSAWIESVKRVAVAPH